MLYYFMVSTGIGWILKYGKIFDIPRNFLSERSAFLAELFKCSMCLGVYTGALITYFVYNEYGIKGLLFPFASSAVCYLFDLIQDFISSWILCLEKQLDLRTLRLRHLRSLGNDHKVD